GNLNCPVRKQAWIDELGDVGGSSPAGQVVDRCEAVGLASTKGCGGSKDAVFSSDARRCGDTTESLGEECLQTRCWVSLCEERLSIAVDRIVLGITNYLVELCCKVIVCKSALEHVVAWHTGGTQRDRIAHSSAPGLLVTSYLQT